MPCVSRTTGSLSWIFAVNTLLARPVGQQSISMMSKDEVGASNIIKTTMECLSEEQQKEVNDMT
jgi:hypothetical protein